MWRWWLPYDDGFHWQSSRFDSIFNYGVFFHPTPPLDESGRIITLLTMEMQIMMVQWKIDKRMMAANYDKPPRAPRENNE